MAWNTEASLVPRWGKISSGEGDSKALFLLSWSSFPSSRSVTEYWDFSQWNESLHPIFSLLESSWVLPGDSVIRRSKQKSTETFCSSSCLPNCPSVALSLLEATDSRILSPLFLLYSTELPFLCHSKHLKTNSDV